MWFQGQNALALATYSNDRKTCETILRATTFDGFNSIGILTPLCVAVLQHNIDLARIFLSLEAPGSSAYDCPSETIHGVCPIQLAQQTKDINMVKLLRPKHNKHLHRNASHGNVSRWATNLTKNMWYINVYIKTRLIASQGGRSPYFELASLLSHYKNGLTCTY